MKCTSRVRVTVSLVAAVFISLCVADAALAQMDPADTLASLKAHAGLEVTLWATEPGVVNPTNMDIDERGRVWVTEAANYRGVKSRAEGDRIVILEDTDQDGKCDTYKVFYQEKSLFAPLGTCKLGNKLYVSQSPDLLVFTIDESGDKPVGKPEVLFTGFTGANHDHGLHAMVFGSDGRFYGNAGNEGTKDKVRDASNKQVVDTLGSDIARGDMWRGKPRGNQIGYQEGMAFRFNPDGTGFETLGHNFRNNYELTVDSFGTVWQSDNDDDGNQGTRLNFVMEGGNFGFKGPTGNDWKRDMFVFPDQSAQEAHWHQRYPGVVPNLVHTGAGSPSGLLTYEGDLLGKEFRGALIHCDPGPNVVLAVRPKPSRDVPTGLMTVNEPPADAPGAGYAAEVIELLKSSDKWFRPVDVSVAPDGAIFVADWYDAGVGGHATADRVEKGGLRGRVYRIAPKGHKATEPNLQLDDIPAAIAALKSPNLATRYLAYQRLVNDPQAAASLTEMFRTDTNPIYRARALWLLARSPAAKTILAEALQDPNEDIRITAVRAARLAQQDMVAIATQMIGDKSYGVLRELALAMNYEPTDRAMPVLVQLADRYDGQDRWYLEAIGIGATGREAELLKTWNEKGKNKDAKVTADIRWRMRGPLAVQEVASSGTRYVDQWFVVAPFHATDDLDTPLALDQQPTVDLNATHQGVGGKALKWEKVSTKPIQDTQIFSFSDLLHGKGFDLKETIGYFATAVVSPSAQEATLLLGCDDKALAYLNGKEVFRSPRGGGIQIDGYKIPITLEKGKNLLLVKLYNVAGGSALTASVKVAAGRQPVELSLKLPTAAELAAQRAEAARPAASTAATRSGEPLKTKDGEMLPSLETLATLDGDPARGEAVFKDAKAANCISCHQVGSEGKMFGPPLTAIGQKLTKAQLLEAVLHPSNALLMGYENWTIQTTEGEVFSGLKEGDTPDRVTIKDTNGQYHDIPVDQIETKIMQKISIMPEGVANTMSKQELLDLIAYLSTLRHPK